MMDAYPNFNRPPRRRLPSLPDVQIDLPAPPPRPAPPALNAWLAALPLASVGLLGLFTLGRAAQDGTSWWLALPFFLLALVSLGGVALAQRWRLVEHERRCIQEDIAYLRLLERKQARLQAAHDAEMALLRWAYPSAQEVLRLALTRAERLWERRPHDEDFLRLRLGIGTRPAALRLQTPDSDSALHHPQGQVAFRLADAYRHLHDAPLVIDLARCGALGVVGERPLLLEAVYALLAHLAALHAPQDVQLHLITTPQARADWDWLEWLPHTSTSQRGGVGELVASRGEGRALLAQVGQMIDARRQQPDGPRTPHLVLLIDERASDEADFGPLWREGAAYGLSLICLASLRAELPSLCQALWQVDEGGFEWADLRQGSAESGHSLDTLARADAEALAQALAGLTARQGENRRLPRRVDLVEAYDLARLDDLRAIVQAAWRRPIPQGVLPFPAPIGKEAYDATTTLWLNEDHDGAHGLVVGTTGSGKSELLQTLVCALAIEHHPRLANFLLIDFKGGSAFRVFEGLPHLVGTITNLDGALIERAWEALRAEVRARQHFLRAANARDVAEYHRLYAASPAQWAAPDYRPLPHLFIIVDEFAQLARQFPDFLRELIQIAQLGRSLGLHLILGTQTTEVISEELSDNLQFRVGLRVQSVEASRALFKRPDAAYLPVGLPGRAYVQVGERGTFKLFQVAYVGAAQAQEAWEGALLELIDEQGRAIHLLATNDESAAQGEAPATQAQAIVRLLREAAERLALPPVTPVLALPLPERADLSQVIALADSAPRWDGAGWRGEARPLSAVPFGLLDDLAERRHLPLWATFSAQASARSGHLLIIGGPSSGKTSALQSLALAIALHHSPQEVHLYGLSLGGRGLEALEALPHAERVVYGVEGERVRRLFGRLLALLDERQSGRAAAWPAVVLLLDGYEAFRDTYYETHLADLERLIAEGRAAALYVILTAGHIGAVSERLRTLLPQRLALQPSSPADLALILGTRAPAFSERAWVAGRGISAQAQPLLAQVASPDGLTQVAEAMRRAAPQAPPPLRELPARLAWAWGESPAQALWGVWDDDALTPLHLDAQAEGGQFMVQGGPHSGKTSALVLAALLACWHSPPAALRLALLDVTGRSLSPLLALPHPARLIQDEDGLRATLDALQQQPDEGAPSTLFLIDDFDLAAEALGSSVAWRGLRAWFSRSAPQRASLWAAGAFERAGDPLARLLLLRRVGFELLAHQAQARRSGPRRPPSPPGRALFSGYGRQGVVQLAWPALDEGLRAIQARWQGHSAAPWPPARPVGKPQVEPAHDQVWAIDSEGLLRDLLNDDEEA